MKTKTINVIKAHLIIVAACVMSLAVVLSSAHAKDIAKASVASDPSAIVGRVGDISAKAIGDLHNHIDKQTLKNISMDNPVAAREREIKALVDTRADRGLVEIIEEIVAFYRLAFALRLSLALA